MSRVRGDKSPLKKMAKEGKQPQSAIAASPCCAPEEWMKKVCCQDGTTVCPFKDGFKYVLLSADQSDNPDGSYLILKDQPLQPLKTTYKAVMEAPTLAALEDKILRQTIP
jgi:hypothetical protein